MLPNPLVTWLFAINLRVKQFFSAPTIFDNEVGHRKCRTTITGLGQVQDLDIPEVNSTRDDTCMTIVRQNARFVVYFGGSKYMPIKHH